MARWFLRVTRLSTFLRTAHQDDLNDERSSRRIKSATWHYVWQRDVSHYGKMALCPRFRAARIGDLFQDATAERDSEIRAGAAPERSSVHIFDFSPPHNRRSTYPIMHRSSFLSVRYSILTF